LFLFHRKNMLFHVMLYFLPQIKYSDIKLSEFQGFNFSAILLFMHKQFDLRGNSWAKPCAVLLTKCKWILNQIILFIAVLNYLHAL